MTNWRGYLVGDVPVPGPWAIAITGISNTAVPAIGSDAVRHGILFHNPNPSTLLRILPVGQPLTSGRGGIAIEPYTCFELYASGGGTLGEDWSRVRINCGWQVVADVAGAWDMTIWTFTDQLGPAAQSRPNRHLPTANLNINPDIPSPAAWQFTNLSTVSAQILPFNLGRRGVLFHNPGRHPKGIAPGNLPASMGAGSVVLLPKGQLEIRAGGKIRCGSAFSAVTDIGNDGTLTALEYL